MLASRPITVGRFKALYRAILKLHRFLPTRDMRYLGTKYVRQEFRQHASLPPESSFWGPFFEQWELYYHTLGQQFLKEKMATTAKDTQEITQVELGRKLSRQEIDAFSEEQLGQLHQLMVETKRPPR